jgi:6-phosphogluconolactonase (cycloisomerase 2 family)
MKSPFDLRRTIGKVVICAVILVLAAFAESSSKSNQLAGSARVISVQEAQTGRAAPTADAETARAEVAQRTPLRAIGDPYGLFSAVGLDLRNKEVVLQDENLFRILTYDRTANTPASAPLSEPKRFIAGDLTNLALNCALYVDPQNGDIYTVNNDSIDSTVVFSRQAKGNVAPDREFHTPHGTFGIAVDEKEQEAFFTVQHSHAVVVFPKMAKDEEPPIRSIQGDHTGLGDPHGIAVDVKNDVIFVSNFGSTNTMRRSTATTRSYGRGPQGKEFWPLDRDDAVPGSGRNVPPSITVYPKKASGDAAPVRVIQGPATQLDWPAGMAVDSDRGELYVANDMGASVLVFSTTANGDAAPIRVLKGPKTLLKYPDGVALDLENHELWVANFGNHAATVYKLDASGDTAPLRIIRSGPLNASVPALGNPFSVAFDTKRKEILVPN